MPLTLTSLIIHGQCGPIFCSCPPPFESLISHTLFIAVAFTQEKVYSLRQCSVFLSIFPKDLEILMISEKEIRDHFPKCSPDQ